MTSTSQTTAAKGLILLDAYSLLFRAHFANPYLSAPDGQPTGALFGFSNMMLSLLKSHEPDAIVVCWDAPAVTLRKQEFEAYKAHRPEVDPNLKAQMPEARSIVTAFGIQSAELPGYEADDLIGTLAVQAVRNGMKVTILTGDSDQLQLVRDGVMVELCRRGVSDVKTYDAAAVIERYGVPPERIPDWKGLVGDTSDNIPGVPGIGEKTATTLLKAWNSVDNLLAHVADLPAGKTRTALEQHAEQARLSTRLATIVLDAPIDLIIEPYAPSEQQWNSIRTKFEALQFKSLLTRLPGAAAKGATEAGTPRLDFDGRAAEPPIVNEITSASQFDEALKSVGQSSTLAITCTLEGTGIESSLKSISFTTTSGEVWIAPVRCDPSASASHGLFDQDDASYGASSAEVGKLLHSKNIACYNAKPTLHAFAGAGLPMPDIAFDSQIAAYLLDSNRSSYPLDDLAVKYLGGKQPTVESHPSAAEAELVLRLVEPMQSEIASLGMSELMKRVEMPLVPILALVERAGLLIDRTYLSTLSIRLNGEMEALGAEIYTLAGEQFNIGSTKQLQVVLFDKLGLPTGKKTTTGFSTGADLLEQLAPDYPIAQKVLDYREISKLKATYADALVKLINPRTGRVHTTLNQTVASTGRLSSSEPNLQNIPIRSELGREIRRAFIAPRGKLLLSCDYSQIELRVLAHMSGDPALTEAFVSHTDVHAATAARVFDVEVAEVTQDQRRRAKTINFAVIYGQSAFALAATLGVDTKTAGEWIKEYFRRLPGVQTYIAETTASARANRYVTTLMGRRRYLPELDSPNHNMRQFAERAAVNMPIQGTAADIMKLAMVAVFHEVERSYSSVCKMLLQVHDELLFEVDEAAIDEVTPVIRGIMEDTFPLSVPVTADAKIGLNWAGMTSVKSERAASNAG